MLVSSQVRTMTRKPDPVDMSPKAIDNRLEDLRQLYRLMLSLAEIKLVGPVERVLSKRTTP